MAGAECELITALRVWGRSLQRGPRAEPLVRGQGAKPPEAESILSFTSASGLPIFVTL